MIRNLYFSFLILSLPAVFYSCKNTSYREEINKIDSMLVQLDSARIILNNIDGERMTEITSAVDEDINFFHEHFEESGDTLDKESSVVITNYRRVSKSGSKIAPHLPNLQNDLDLSEKQLKDLRHDVEKNVLTEGQVKKHVREELLASRAVVEEIKKFSNNAIGFDLLFKKHKPYIDSLRQNIEGSVNVP